MKVSDIVITFLENKSIKHVFTVSGGGCIHLIDSLGKSKKISYVCTHHEQAAAMAAEGYARLGDTISACIVTTGPGGTNTLTGVLGNWLDSIPVIYISGQVPLKQTSEGTNCRQIGDQEFNIVSSVSSMTKYAVMVKNKNDILYELEKAYSISTSGRPGPVWIDIPLDIQGAEVEEKDLKIFTDNKQSFNFSIEEKNKFQDLILNSKKPLFVVGNGIRLSNCYDQFNTLLEKLKIPALSGVHSGVDCINNEYEYYAGRIGILGNLTSNQIIQESDLLIIVGSRLNVKMTGYNIKGFAPKSKKIYIDIDSNEILKHKFNIDLKLVNDIKNIINFCSELSIPDISSWQSYVKETRKKQIKYYPKHENIKDFTSCYYFISKLEKNNNRLPIITSDGSAHVITLQTLILKKHQRMFTNVGCASMGYGLPAAIGACFYNNKKPVICLEGDGSLQMNIQELQTVVHHKLPIKIFVINNDGYISIKITQQSFFNGRQFASGKESGVSFPDLKKISDAYGIKYFSIKNNSEIDTVLSDVMNTQEPLVCEVFSHPNEKHEPKVVHKGITENGEIIPGDLTDMLITEDF